MYSYVQTTPIHSNSSWKQPHQHHSVHARLYYHQQTNQSHLKISYQRPKEQSPHLQFQMPSSVSIVSAISSAMNTATSACCSLYDWIEASSLWLSRHCMAWKTIYVEGPLAIISTLVSWLIDHDHVAILTIGPMLDSVIVCWKILV